MGKMRVEVGLGFANRERRLGGFGWAHSYIDIFKDLARRDASQAVRGFDQVVSFLSMVFASQGVDEVQGFGELSGPDEEPGTVDLPIGCGLHNAHTLCEGKSVLRWSVVEFKYLAPTQPKIDFAPGEEASSVVVWRIYARGPVGSIP